MSSRPLSRKSVHFVPCRASLYERPVNLETAKAAHAEFRRVMREAGVKVLTVRDVMAYGVGDHSAHAARWLPARWCRAAAGRRVTLGHGL
jgi:arginine deiminase